MRSSKSQSLLTGPSSYSRLFQPSAIMLSCLTGATIISALLLMDSVISITALVAFSALICTIAILLKMNANLLAERDGLLHFEETLEAITDIYWQWDLSTGQFQYNGIMASLLGYEDRKPSDGFWKEIIHPVDRPLQKYHLLRHLNDESIPYYCEYRFLDNNQEYQWFAGKGRVVRRDSNQRPLLMVGSVEHIQPRKDMEQSLIHAHKMEALGQLTGGIAHDFNNIMGTVMGYAELSMETDSPTKMQQYAGQIHQAGTRARNVVRQLLDFSRTSKGEIETVDLQKEMEDSILMVQSTLPSTIEISSHWPEQACMARLDPNQLQRVLLNLCINARDAMSGTGSMELSLASKEIESTRCASCQKMFSGRFSSITVADTGAGIQPSSAPKLFEPFFTTKAFGEGTGMGLSVVHGIIHDAGGHIALESEAGVGTRFHLLLPTAIDDAEDKANEAEALVDGAEALAVSEVKLTN